MISLQTNVTSLFAQQQLNQNSNFESNTIQQLTSGYRINNAGDDAAGLAVANQLQANVAELQQGVINAANGTSTLQIIDGGLSNISNLLDRLQTLATESASGTFSGQPHHAEQRVHIGVERNYAPGRQHRFGFGRNHLQHRHHRLVAVQHHRAWRSSSAAAIPAPRPITRSPSI